MCSAFIGSCNNNDNNGRDDKDETINMYVSLRAEKRELKMLFDYSGGEQGVTNFAVLLIAIFKLYYM